VLPQLPDEGEEIFGGWLFHDLVLLHQDRDDLLERSLLAQQMPDPRANRVQAEIEPSVHFEHDELALEIPEEDVVGNLDSS